MTTILTIKGIVEPVQPAGSGIDWGGYFGPPGASLAGDEFTITWSGTPCECNSNSPNPISVAALTINEFTYNFDTSGYGIWRSDFQQTQTDVNSGGFVTNISGIVTNLVTARGSFFIDVACCDGIPLERAYLQITSVPGPVAGAGLPSLLLVVALIRLWKRSRT